MKFPCCCNPQDCLLNSTDPAVGKPFFWTPEPPETVDGSVVLFEGDSYVLTHEEVQFAFDPDVETQETASNSSIKVAQWIIKLGADARVRVWYEWFESGDHDDIGAGSGAFIEYRIVEREFYDCVDIYSGERFNTDGSYDDPPDESDDAYVRAVILDEYISDYRVYHQTDGMIDNDRPENGSVATTGAAAPLTPVRFNIDRTPVIGVESLDSLDLLVRVGGSWPPVRSHKIKLECITGSATVELLQVYLSIHADVFGEIEIPGSYYEGCLEPVGLPPTYVALCGVALGGDMQTTGYIAYSLPLAVLITLPTWEYDPTSPFDDPGCCGDFGGTQPRWVLEYDPEYEDQHHLDCTWIFGGGLSCGELDEVFTRMTIREDGPQEQYVDGTFLIESDTFGPVFDPFVHSEFLTHTSDYIITWLLPDDIEAAPAVLSYVPTTWNARVVIDHLRLFPSNDSVDGDWPCAFPLERIPIESGSILDE